MGDMVDSEDDEDSDDAGPTTSTQIERRSSKRLLISSTTTSTEDEDEPVRGKRNSKGGKVPKSGNLQSLIVNQDDLTVPRIPQRDHLAKPANAPRQQLKNDPENNVLLTGHEI